MSVKVSIIVPSHRPEFIRELLCALRKQDFDKELSEIIIVTDYILDSLPDEYPEVIWKFLGNRSISAKRNLGVSASSGEIVAFIDDDCIPEIDWLSQGAGYLRTHKDAEAVEGLTTIGQSHKITGVIKEYRRLEKPGFRTNNIFYRKEIFLKAGGFDERFTVQREDLDLAFKVLELGGKIDHNPDIKVKHRFRHWERWDLLKNCWNRRFDPLLYRKFPERYRKQIGSPFPPGIVTLLGAYIVLPFLFWKGSFIGLVLYANMVLIVVLAAKRTGAGQFALKRFIYETISVIVAPLVLFGALVYGSLRFKKILLF